MLFNWYGYRFAANYLEDIATNDLQTQLDKNQYNESDLVSIKVALAMPYTASSEQFENIEGTLDVNGISFQYVKRRYFKDSLEVLCIPNLDKTNIRSARVEFDKLASEFVNLQAQKKTTNSHNHVVKVNTQDLNCQHYFDLTTHRFSNHISCYNNHNITHLSQVYLASLDRPPVA